MKDQWWSLLSAHTENELSSITCIFLEGILKRNSNVNELQRGQSFQNVNLRSPKPKKVKLLPRLRFNHYLLTALYFICTLYILTYIYWLHYTHPMGLKSVLTLPPPSLRSMITNRINQSVVKEGPVLSLKILCKCFLGGSCFTTAAKSKDV